MVRAPGGRSDRGDNFAGSGGERDFIRLLDEQGPPPQVIWLRLGNSSNAALQQVLSTTLLLALELLRNGEPWVEIRPQTTPET